MNDIFSQLAITMSLESPLRRSKPDMFVVKVDGLSSVFHFACNDARCEIFFDILCIKNRAIFLSFKAIH